MTASSTATAPATSQAAGRYLEPLAELLVGYGANVQPGQIVAIGAELGKEPLVRALTAASYRHGAKFVDVTYVDPFIKLARLENAAAESLEEFPSWYGHKMLELGEQRCARISLSGPVEPHLLDDVDPELIGREKSGPRAEAMRVMNDRTTNWTIGPCPTADWAELVFPDLEPAAALERLWTEMAHVCRLDEADPVAAWMQRLDQLVAASGALTKAKLDSLHFTGPGTDLTVGLLPDHAWLCIAFETADGLRHAPNVPSEEVFTSPDPLRTQGHVRSTKPLVVGGTIVEDLEVVFEAGRAVKINASKGADVLRGMAARDDGAAMLGEVALVDGSGRIGPLGTVYYDTLLDENAASHIALGRGFDYAVTGDVVERVNQSEIHIDFMIGGPGVQVHGVPLGGGDEVPVLVDGAWKL